MRVGYNGSRLKRLHNMTTLADLRINYSRASLDEADVAHDPFAQFDRWFKEALAAKLPEPNTMTLATVGDDGRPSARIVLIKGVDERGFVFFTNYESRKGRDLAAHPQAAQRDPVGNPGHLRSATPVSRHGHASTPAPRPPRPTTGPRRAPARPTRQPRPPAP